MALAVKYSYNRTAFYLYCAGLQTYFILSFNDCIITFTDYESKLHNYATPTNVSIGIIVECQS